MVNVWRCAWPEYGEIISFHSVLVTKWNLITCIDECARNRIMQASLSSSHASVRQNSPAPSGFWSLQLCATPKRYREWRARFRRNGVCKALFFCCCIWCIERTARGTFARRTSSHIVCHLAMRHFLFFVWARSSAHTRQRRRRWQAPLQHHIKCDNVITRNAKMPRRPRRPGAKRLTVTATVTLDGSAEYNVYMCVYAFQKDGKRERRMRVPLTMQTPSWWRVRGAERLTISKLAT